MDSLELSDRKGWDPMEDALRTYPLEQPPSNLYANVMKGICPTTESHRETKTYFRLFSWLDAFVSLFFSMMFGLVLLIGRIIPSQMIPSLNWTANMIRQPVVSIPLLISLLMAGCGLVLLYRMTERRAG